MHGKRILFTAPNVVELVDFELDEELAPNDVIIRNAYTLVSPGTELACLAGTESWAPLPFAPGYASCGVVIAVGSAVRHTRAGDRVLCYGKHASVVKVNRLVAPLPEGLALRLAPFARMAAVSLTALRVAQPELGDWVAVLGQGLVGNLAAQLLNLAGCEAIGIDPEPARLRAAAACGVRHLINPRERDQIEAVEELTHGRRCETVVDATGLPAVVEGAARLAGVLGQVILLGSPRADHETNLTPFLNQIHLWGNGCVTFKGAHEWRFPTARDPNGFHKHSIERNLEILLGYLRDGRLAVEPLITHVLPPAEAPRAYAGLREHSAEYMGVLFDWTA